MENKEFNNTISEEEFIKEAIGVSVDTTDIEQLSLIWIEECSEMIQALTKFRRLQFLKQLNFNGENIDKYKYARENIIEEMSDVEICLDELKKYLNISKDEINEVKVNKLKRHYKRSGIEIPNIIHKDIDN